MPSNAFFHNAFVSLSEAKLGVMTHAINYGNVNDPNYDNIFAQANSTLDQEEQYKLVKEADAYATAHYWRVITPLSGSYNIYQPWFKGYSGETLIPYNFARMWVDQNLRK